MVWDMVDATRRWIAGTGERTRRVSGGRRALPPWEENQWFQAIKRNLIGPVAADTQTQIAKADPQRVMLMFASPGTSVNYVDLVPGVSSQNGIQVQATTLPFRLFQAEDGPLCNAEWFAFIPLNGSLLIIEVSLRDWP